MSNPLPSAWIAVDASTPQLRGWIMQGDKPHGPASQVADLEAAASLMPDVPILVAGLAHSETVMVPAKPSDSAPKAVNQLQGRLFAAPGLTQARPFGRLKGAERRIEGFLGYNPDWDGVICLPGPHTHWVLVSAAEVVSFQSFATWPLVEALCPSEVLQTPPDPAALRAQMQDVLSKPENIATRVAQAREAWQAGRLTAPETCGMIWGAALGAELAASRPYWLGQNLALIAPEALALPYREAFDAQALPVTQADDTRMLLDGLCRAARRLPQMS